MKRTVVVVLFLLTACVPSPKQQAWHAYQRGDKREYCRISAEHLPRQPSMHSDIGACFENGWGDEGRNMERALYHYRLGARYGYSESQNALIRLGQEVPAPDLSNLWNEERARHDASRQFWTDVFDPAPRVRR